MFLWLTLIINFNLMGRWFYRNPDELNKSLSQIIFCKNNKKTICKALNKKAALICSAFLFLVSGCAFSESSGGSRRNVVAWASDRGFVEKPLTVGLFNLLVLTRSSINNTSKIMTVYIEGDGASWITPWHPPRDPTPRKATALALAAADPAEIVVYMGRPCQYPQDDESWICDPAWWMECRFAPEVLQAYDEALDKLKSSFGVERFRLVGYSGGGIIAALLSARRSDVARLVTVASPLSLNNWLAWHNLSPFSEFTVDPVSVFESFAPAVHWAGANDKIVPPAIIEHFVGEKVGQVMLIVPDYDHECCWVQDWPQLILREGNAK
jgi:hypothetical protein